VQRTDKRKKRKRKEREKSDKKEKADPCDCEAAVNTEENWLTIGVSGSVPGKASEVI
jgi:hypothetical protein